MPKFVQGLQAANPRLPGTEAKCRAIKASARAIGLHLPLPLGGALTIIECLMDGQSRCWSKREI
jgi:hypothetical protein